MAIAARTRVMRSLTAALALALALAVAVPAFAQYTSNPSGAPGIDLGPSARPTGVPPNSGLLPGTPARPPGEPSAGSYSPVNPLPNRPASVSPRVQRAPDIDQPPAPPRRDNGPPALPKSTEFCREHPRNTRCRAGG